MMGNHKGDHHNASDRVLALAARCTVSARARLCAPGTRPIRLAAIGAQVERLRESMGAPTPAVEWLSSNIHMIETQAAALAHIRTPRLPAMGGVPRVRLLADALIEGGDVAPAREALFDALVAFDKTQGLTMAEWQWLPDALRFALVDAFYENARETLFDLRARVEAERFVASGGSIRFSKTPPAAFCERALALLDERGSSDAARAFESYLDAREGGLDAVIRRAHERQAFQRLRYENIFRLFALLRTLSWDTGLSDLSRCEQTLREDCLYPRMDKPSRERLREAVSALSTSAGLSEWTIARHALSAAQASEQAPQTSVCWWLYDDAGRIALFLAMKLSPIAPPRRVPDPNGRIYGVVRGLLALALLALLGSFTQAWGFLLPLLPICLRFAAEIENAVLARVVRPTGLLRLAFDRIEEPHRTLVVLPALLSGERRARALVDNLEALGCLSLAPEFEFLLLGDLRDAPDAHLPEDEAILAAARDGVAGLNERSERPKYHFLCRPRVYHEADGRYMARERKRGALMALCDLLLRRESAFFPEDHGPSGRFDYIITLDADTRALPDALRQMVGAMAHPLNKRRIEDGRARGCAILQPRVELTSGNRFAACLAGRGGMDSYPAAVSDVYQDFSGRGLYTGKGILDLASFDAALRGVLPDGAILSHDLIEGAIAGTARLGDVTVFDDFPATLGGYVKRLERWTRGDWQLLPFIASRLPIPGFYRFLMIDNLIGSLVPLCALLLTVLALWTRNAPALLVALLVPSLPLLLSLPHVGGEDVTRAVCRFSLLPLEAFTQTSAICRALSRVYRTRRDLLSWTPAADAEGGDALLAIPGRVAVILLLPALFTPAWVLPMLGVGALFFISADWMQALSDVRDAVRLSASDIARLQSLAEKTWYFFETFVPLDGPGLPPDNVQLDPPVGVAPRTSPTNIGLYLVGCVAARTLRLIDAETASARIAQTVQTLEALPKWHGHLYNWYDVCRLAPLAPRYVSSVDSGNLVACLLLTARDQGGALGARLEALARATDFTPLYDPVRKLFFIGADIEHGHACDSHYDLLASEARILSFVALALNQIPTEHWFALGRGRSGYALKSWSGTLFESLMPELFLRAPAGTLLDNSHRAVVRAQRRAHPELWGVSESGYFAFDLSMNYQYRAFGLPALSLRGDAFDNVVAPYASLLALPYDARAVLDNVEAMATSGLLGEYGLYEAIDLDPSRLPDGETRRVVFSHMAHHQGMILAAICNALTDDSLAHTLMARPEARALSLLLAEKSAPPARVALRGRRVLRPHAQNTEPPLARTGRATQDGAPDLHVVAGGGGTALCGAAGILLYQKDGVCANRFRDGLFPGERDGIFVRLRIDKRALSPERAIFLPGEARYFYGLEGIDARLRVALSPEDGALTGQLTLKNTGEALRHAQVDVYFAVALASPRAFRAHPAFSNLFVRAECVAPRVLRFERRSRTGDPSEACALGFALQAPPAAQWAYETDLSRAAGRNGDLSQPEAPLAYAGQDGFPLDPCAAQRVRFDLRGGATESVTFHLSINTASPADVAAAASRALSLAPSQARAMMNFLSLDAPRYHLLCRASALLVYPLLRMGEPGVAGLSARTLWALGLSGDLPLLCLFIDRKEQLGLARALLKAHEFYRSANLRTDLVFVNDYGNDYNQPVRDQLTALLESSPLQRTRGETGGAYLLEGESLTPAQREALRQCAALLLIGQDGGFATQLERALAKAVPDERPARRALRPLRALPPVERLNFNGFGGFLPDAGYAVDLTPKAPLPAPYANILANGRFGALVTERGGGFVFLENSRMQRVTPFAGDPLREGFCERIALREADTGREAAVLPVQPLARAVHRPGETQFIAGTDGLSWTLSVFVDCEKPLKGSLLTLRNLDARPRSLTLLVDCRFLMGEDAESARFTRFRAESDHLLGLGALPGVAYLRVPGAKAQHGRLQLHVNLAAGEEKTVPIALGYADGADDIPSFDLVARRQKTQAFWADRLTRIELRTPDPILSQMVSRFLPYQVLVGRVLGRTGLYQPGGALGFRDQLQDMLALLPIEPERVREHLLVCAARQFPEGDVLHWWHPPYQGVRTRIADDLLFLPYVAARYVAETGDRSVLQVVVPYLQGEAIPEDQTDLYRAYEPSERADTLYVHGLKAIRLAARTGAHGLPLMGHGDWNDGMNRVGEDGGESVWLAEFLSVVADEYAPFAQDEAERLELRQLAQAMRDAVEQNGWDGGWYRRAYFADGTPLGSAETQGGCQIDLIAQAFSVFAGLNPERAKTAMDAAYTRLFDPALGLFKLLDPPFQQPPKDPGYIAAYPPGIRENGGQYTHAACWGALALFELGETERAFRVFSALFPHTHTVTREAAERYRAEPYALAGDVYSQPPYAGRGGWTWYTGAAAWLMRTAYEGLMGYTRIGDRVRLNPRIPDAWQEASVVLRVGSSTYELVATHKIAPHTDEQDAEGFVRLVDDGGAHRIFFAVRPSSREYLNN